MPRRSTGYASQNIWEADVPEGLKDLGRADVGLLFGALAIFELSKRV